MVPESDQFTVRVRIGGKDHIAFRFITSNDRVGKVIDVFYGEYVHTVSISPSGRKAKVWESKRAPQPAVKGGV
jgi:hypothetical protein